MERSDYRHLQQLAAGVFAWLSLTAGGQAQNFSTVDADVRNAAEVARDRCARFWSGAPLPGRWSSPCPIHWSEQTGSASGMTRFQFDRGEVSGWRMTLRGDRRSVLFDVVPHEVDHAVRASLCRRPLPRWLDEGCASLFESETSHEQLRMMRQLDPRHAITIETIDRMRYPDSSRETAQLYAEGFSFVEYLLERSSPGDLLQVQRSSDPPSRSLRDVYRVDVQQLLSEWNHWETQRSIRGFRCGCVNCPWHAPGGEVFNAGEGTGVSERTHDALPVLTVWSATWCQPCQRFHHDFSTDASFRRQLGSKFRVVVRDLDRSRAKAQRRGVTSVPVFESDDHRVEGYLGTAWLLRELGIVKNDDPPRTNNLREDKPHSEESAPPPAEETPASPRPPVGSDAAPVMEPSQSSSPSSVSTTNPPSTRSPMQEPDAADPSSEKADERPVSSGAPGSRWGAVLTELVPAAVSILSSIGVVGGTAVSGGVGGVVLVLLMNYLRRRATRSESSSVLNVEGGVAVSARAPFPRKLDEAGELLGLRQSEGRVATLDTLRGMFLDDELEKLSQDADPGVVSIVKQIRRAVDQRVDEVAPLTTKV